MNVPLLALDDTPLLQGTDTSGDAIPRRPSCGEAVRRAIEVWIATPPVEQLTVPGRLPRRCMPCGTATQLPPTARETPR